MPPKPEPTALKPLFLVGYTLLLPVTVAIMVAGLVGIQILLDSEGKSSISRTEFGRLYRKVIAVNPFFSAIFVNGGMIGSLFFLTKLLDHRKAVKAAAGKPVKQLEAETKKDK